MKRIKQIITLLLALSLVLGTLAACGSKETEKEEEQPTQEKAETKGEKTVIRLGYNPVSGNLLTFIAQDKGFFEEENVDVELVAFNSTADGIAAMNAGKVDVSFSFGSNSPLQYISEGSDLKFIGGYLSNGHPIFTLPENEGNYDSSSKESLVNSFKGKKVGTLRLYTSEIIFKSALADVGVDPEKDLEIVEFKKPADIVSAVRSGNIDVAVASGSSYTMAKEAGLSVVGRTNDLWPDHICCRGIATEDFYENNQDAIVGLFRALLKAQEVYEADFDYANKLNADKLGIDEQTSKEILVESGQTINLDPNKKGVIELYDVMVKQDLIENEFDVSSYIDPSLYQKALQSLADENPDDEFFKKQLDLYGRQNA